MHLYLHIPFCHEICPYCSFYKHKPGSTSQEQFVEALLTELDWHGQIHDLSQIETLYLGGGTPSLLSQTHLKTLFQGLHQRLNFQQLKEVTLEANPSTFNLSKATLIGSLGVTRVSLGVQSFDPAQLKVLGRDHSREEAITSYHLLRQAGIPSVNLDLMFSTPGQDLDSWTETLTTAIELTPDHISCYNLTYEEDTAYFDKFLSGDYTDEPERNESFYLTADRMLQEAGYLHYETSNYAKPGNLSLHNQGYWRGNPYLGLGPSAVSCIDRKRSKNISDTQAYISRMQSSVGHAVEDIENLDDEAWRLERLALELRTTQGCPLKYVERESLQTLIDHDLITIVSDRFKTTNRGSCLVDSIVEYLA